jgi:hypothetical protein
VKVLSILLFIFVALPAKATKSEVEAAREGAPEHISNNATVMIWKNGEYTEEVKGTNEFVCIVWADIKGTFEPSCLNQAAVEAVLPVYQFQRRMIELGVDINKVMEQVSLRAKSGDLPSPKPGALVYMMSERNKYFDHYGGELYDVEPHIMLYFPKLKESSIGFNKPGLPDLYDDFPHLSVIHLHAGSAHEKHNKLLNQDK